MKVLLSPAKMLDYDNPIHTPFTTEAHFVDNADYLAKKLARFSSKELGELMKISQPLSDLNVDRYQHWEKPTQLTKDAQPAVTVFNGEVYKGLDVASFSEKEFKKAQQTIRILSGLYGVLKPLDLMYPYRLEMGTRWNVTPKTKNLYAYWGTQVVDFLNTELEAEEAVVNLASNEYFKVIPKGSLNARVITPVFKELKGDKFKVVMMYAKHARGAMARDIIQQNYQSVEDLKGYTIDGYSFSEEMSKGDEWVFIR